MDIHSILWNIIKNILWRFVEQNVVMKSKEIRKTGGKLAKSAKTRKGTQSISRALQILRLVAQAGAKGLRASEISTEVGLSLPTTHRVLGALNDEALVERVGESKLYRIGPEIFALSARAEGRFSIVNHFDGVLTALAEETADTVFLSIRSGSDSVCVARREGAFPIRTLALDVGARRPIGVGAGSLALLAFAPPEERLKLIAENAERYAKFDINADEISVLAKRSRALGYALYDSRIIRSMTAIGVPVATQSGKIVAAISVSAINERMSAERQAEIAKMIKTAIVGRIPLPD